MDHGESHKNDGRFEFFPSAIEETAKVANYRTVYFPLDHPDGVLIQSIISCARRSSAYCYDILTDRTLEKTVLLDSVLVGSQSL